MSLPFKSLDAATATGAGASHDLEAVVVSHQVAAVLDAGTSPSATVYLEGSHDGVNWFRLGDASAVTLGTVGSVVKGSVQSGLVRYVRANLTALSGAGATVTATVSSL